MRLSLPRNELLNAKIGAFQQNGSLKQKLTNDCLKMRFVLSLLLFKLVIFALSLNQYSTRVMNHVWFNVQYGTLQLVEVEVQ